ncbi:glutamate receptor ionotropic, NMDA 2D-like isoform X2 [Phymastichus coffea]|uniref:glutamate receptor ionotropic, NMDA 2D-like isoform X2 n=1 Tax=Phymastichus coffea TaxID=108790 RepID=UPI00273CD6E1|nr:glutamate receptor ionotropic, NMDA 2D-like isoform X2 [Phymastichus coffea]
MRSGWSALAWLLLGSSLALGPRADDAGFGHGGSSGSGHPGAAQRTSSTIKIGKYDRSSGLGGLGGLGGTGQRGSSMIKIGEGSKLLNISRVVRPLLTTSMTSTTIPLSYASVSPESQGSAEFSNGTKMLKVGLAVPYKSFGYREYTKAVSRVVTALQKSTKRPNLGLFQHYDIFVKVAMQELTPSPMNILNSLCKEFLSLNVSAILYLMNYEQYGRSTASTQYFLQLAGYLGIPVIAWNADNSGLERSSLHLQLAPSIEHQAAAMLSILERYKWHQFSVVTSQIAGHDDFVQAVRERISDMQERFKFTMLNAVTVTKSQDLKDLVSVESRVMLLYSSKEEANNIFRHAAEFKITGENYVWVVTQSVIQNIQPGHHFPVGMIGVHFDTSSTSIVNEIATAIKVYAYGVEDFVNDPRNYGYSLNTQLSCEDLSSESRWSTGEYFFKYLKNVSVEAEYGKPSVEFTQDGVLKSAELKIMNLRPGPSMQLVWEEIGAWKSWEKDGLDIKDIVWPGNTHTPPPGVPEKFHVKIAFLEEPPYINLAPPDPVTGKCLVERGVHCRVAKDPDEADAQAAARNGTAFQCCSGFCIDLLQKFSEEMGFTYELVRVEDGKWGTIENGKWNGLMAELVNRKTDMVMTSLKINSEREAVVDFSVPFMETGSAIVVAKRTGIISPTAFLEPFDTASWMLVGFVAIHSATFMIFLFEWLSPSSFGMPDYSAGTKPKPRRQQHRQHQRQHQRHRYRHEREPLQQPAKPPRQQHRFSLCRVYWLVWAVLFQAAVHVDSPRGFTARFMTNVWAMFAVVFLAIYTANLAAFMITREEFFDFSGVDDQRLARPTSHKPPIKFGTVPFTHTDSVLAKYFKEMYAYMRTHSKGSVSEGVEAVVNGDLDAFIYDGTVIDYLVSQDQDCRLLTVGSWYAMTGYGLAFPRNSRFLKMFNQKLLEYRDNGDLERLRRFWMTGTCRPDKEVQKSSDPLALEQFLSAFLMLMVGTLIAAFLLLLEHLYSTYVRRRLAKDARAGRCCGLLSSVSTRSSPAPPSLHARLSCACSASRPAPPRRGDSSEPSRRRLFLEAAARRLGHAGTPRREGRLGRAQPWLSRMCTAAFLRCSTCYK